MCKTTEEKIGMLEISIEDMRATIGEIQHNAEYRIGNIQKGIESRESEIRGLRYEVIKNE